MLISIIGGLTISIPTAQVIMSKTIMVGISPIISPGKLIGVLLGRSHNLVKKIIIGFTPKLFKDFSTRKLRNDDKF